MTIFDGLRNADLYEASRARHRRRRWLRRLTRGLHGALVMLGVAVFVAAFVIGVLHHSGLRGS